MLRACLLTALALTGPQAPEDTAIEGSSGTASEAMAALVRLASEEPEQAAALATQLIEDPAYTEQVRAEFHYARGRVRALHGLFDPSQEDFGSARALAGPGILRREGTYNQGTAQLLQAEAARAALLAGAPSPQPGSAPEDPLAQVRAAYLRARATLLARLRADFNDVDTRANLELIQRRLRELEQQEEQQEPQEQSGGEQEEGEQGDQGEQGEQEEGDEQQGQEPSEGEDAPEGSESAPSEPAPDAAEPTSPEPPGESQELPEVEPGQSSDAAPAERLLTREEVVRLLDRLEQLEDEAATLEDLLRESRRISVEKDW